MKISKILQKFPSITEIKAINDPDILWISENSKTCPSEPWIFIARKGMVHNGWDYIDEAIKNGAVAVISNHIPDQVPDINILFCEELHKILIELIPFLYNYPEKHIKLLGVTGTNGKTTVTYILSHLLPDSARIGTTSIIISDEIFPTTNTTPDLSTIYFYLNKAVKNNQKYFIMEVTSHAIKLNRLGNLEFDALFFTNLGRDHLDFHKSIEEYENVKLSLFEDSLKYRSKKCKHFINIDDTTGKKIIDILIQKGNKAFTISLNDQNASLYSHNINCFSDHCIFKISDETFSINMPGKYNISNSLLAIAYLVQENKSLNLISKTLKQFSGVPGRMETFSLSKGKVIIDFAHTPDSLNAVLSSIRETQKISKIFTIFGCGGNRDRGKRPEMGKIAAKYSDFIILTDDNPRFEEPQMIIDEIIQGFPSSFKAFMIKRPRDAAIKLGISMLKENDILLIAGKGHEDYQEIRGERVHFSDKEIVLK